MGFAAHLRFSVSKDLDDEGGALSTRICREVIEIDRVRGVLESMSIDVSAFQAEFFDGLCDAGSED